MATDVVDLGSMAVLVGTVALGWEKISMERNSLQKQLTDLQTKIAKAITQLDLEISYCNRGETERHISAAWLTEDHYFLLCIGLHPERMHYPQDKRRKWDRRQFWTAPFLSFMKTGWHIGIVLMLTWISLLCFLLQKAGQVWAFSSVFGLHAWPDTSVFWIYTLTIVTTLLFSMIAHRLARIEPKCDKLLAELKRQKQHEQEKLEEMMESKLNDFAK